MFIGPQSVLPAIIQPGSVEPAFVTPGGGSAPPAYAPTPYLLEFLTAGWNTENGANWITPQGLGTFNAPGDVSHDAQTPNDPTWTLLLDNAEPSIAGDAKFEGYILPVSSANQGQMQVAKFDFAIGTGYVALCVWIGTATGTMFIFASNANVFSMIASGAIDTAANTKGAWLKVVQVGPQALVTGYTRNVGGLWTQRATALDSSGAASTPTKPAVIFNSSGGTPVPDAQIYHANKFVGNRDGSITP